MNESHSTLTQERLKELLHYDLETGIFTWIKSTSRRVRVGSKAGSIDYIGYLRIRLDKYIYQAHRLAWLYAHGQWPTNEIDHMNGVKLDNRLVNLRDVDHKTNGENKTRHNKNSALGILGVRQDGNRFISEITVQGKNRSVGRFDSAEEASAAYIAAKRELHIGCTL